MGLLFDVLIPALIIFGVAFVWLRTLLARFIPAGRPGGPQDPRRTGAHPRSLASSGGFQPAAAQNQAPTRNIPAERQWEASPPAADYVRTPPPKRERQAPPSATSEQQQSRTGASPQARALMKAMQSPGTVRTGFLIKEVLEPPVSMRDPANPVDGRA